jgi:two-component system, cell cycle sensor histidine kinase and response regulator CckA
MHNHDNPLSPDVSAKMNPTAEAVERRRRAEEQLRQQFVESTVSPKSFDAQRLVHELQVHQIELELQNQELQQARDTMEAALEKYSDLYDFAPVGYLTLDREGTIQEVNLIAAKLLGTDRSGLLKRRIQPHVLPSDVPAFSSFLRKVFESKSKETCEFSMLGPLKAPVSVRIEATLAASGHECRAALTDNTERKQAEVDRLILSKLESTGILAGGIAHDFNNLLTVILLNVELAEVSASTGDEFAHHLEDARKTVMLARGLTQQLIAFAQGGDPSRKPTRLDGVIRESVRMALSGSRVHCEFHLDADLWWVEVDESQIGQVFRNIVLNANESMPNGGRISARAVNHVVEPGSDPSLSPGDYVRVSIADQGGGMPKALLPKIFDPYFSTKQRGNQKGMGLGLTVCHAIVQKHRGRIVAESEEGVGTTFHVHLPAFRKEIRMEPKVPGTTSGLRPGRILVMDDEEGVREVMGALLKRLGCDVALAPDGAAAIEDYMMARRMGRPFDTVILDLTVREGMGGQQTMQSLLKLDPTVKGIVMSGYSDDPVILEPKRYGFKAVLSKPFCRDTLQTVLACVVEG